MRPLLLLLAWSVAALPARGAEDCAADGMVVLDGSASMAEIGFETGVATRIDEARRAVREAMPRIAQHRRLGLLSYGGGAGGPCSGVRLHFPPVADAAGAIIAAVDALEPEGLTPLAASVLRAAEVLDYTRRPGVIVVVTDGNESCGGTPCATGVALASGARDLTIHVIGYRMAVDFFTWDNPEQAKLDPGATVAECLSDATGGLFVTADTVDDLVAALDRTLGCPVLARR